VDASSLGITLQDQTKSGFILSTDWDRAHNSILAVMAHDTEYNAAFKAALRPKLRDLLTSHVDIAKQLRRPMASALDRDYLLAFSAKGYDNFERAMFMAFMWKAKQSASGIPITIWSPAVALEEDSSRGGVSITGTAKALADAAKKAAEEGRKMQLTLAVPLIAAALLVLAIKAPPMRRRVA
jgi:hypothetical protein